MMPQVDLEDRESIGAKEALTIDGATQSVIPTPLKIDLATPLDVRREMAKVYRDMKEGRIDPGDGTKLVYVLVQIGNQFETQQLNDRVEALHRAMDNRQQRIPRK
jgi:hypothetical protein